MRRACALAFVPAVFGARASIGDIFDSITAPGDHVLAVKTTLWISPR